MEHKFYEDLYEEEKQGSSRKEKRLGNKRERLQVKNSLQGIRSPKDFINEDLEDDDLEDEILYKN